jgi:rifampicin phosphotransferase
MSLIAWLDSAEATPARAGGKGASLARLGAAGFPVPPGFVVTVEAYREFHRAAGLDDALHPLARLPERPAPADVRAACAELEASLAQASLPASVKGEILTALERLGEAAGRDATYAVRSSSASEDGAGASFAGLYESHLNLWTPDQVLEAVRNCYSCLWQPRAVQYRAIKRIDHAGEEMAVVVMQTVHSAVSGVAFSMNPVTGADDEVVINASWGLGEAVVSGVVTPDNYVARKDGTVIRRDIFEKETQVVAVPGGTEQRAVPAELASRPTLDDACVAEVATAVAAIEAQYGCPIDVEFAYDGDGRFYLLQARPVTTR